mmetsp:Transcript_4363/g.4932  ORF Transcript_4363/g.4932 Transcript_4363/m.4932 type:complete len:89 (-) Transcript_4363:396-662(-)
MKHVSLMNSEMISLECIILKIDSSEKEMRKVELNTFYASLGHTQSFLAEAEDAHVDAFSRLITARNDVSLSDGDFITLLENNLVKNKI